MRIILADGLFDGSVPKPHLTALLYFGFQGRHRVIVRRGPCFEGWLKALAPDEREQYEAAIAWSSGLEAREEAAHQIEVGGSGVTIEEAIARLGRPFLILLENDRSDRSFVEAVASPQQRARLSSMEKKGWAEVRCRGGLTGIAPMIDAELARFPADAGRMFAIFDGDAPEPGSPTKDARDAQESCQRHCVEHRMLERRSIENYLTRGALKAWAEDQAGSTDTWLYRVEQLYAPWFEEDPKRRHHYPMKKGFGSLTPKPSLYKDVPNAIDKALGQGFGPDIYKAFVPDRLREDDLRAEGAWEELSGLMEALMRSMR